MESRSLNLYHDHSLLHVRLLLQPISQSVHQTTSIPSIHNDSNLLENARFSNAQAVKNWTHCLTGVVSALRITANINHKRKKYKFWWNAELDISKENGVRSYRLGNKLASHMI